MQTQSVARDRSSRALIVFLFAALPLFGQDAASVVLDPAPNFAAALKSPDALTRTAAARVATVRGGPAVVPALREALAAEKDAVAAREEVRALVILGGDEDIAFAAAQLPRFPASIDGDFAEAVARLGAPRATDLYLKHVRNSRSPSVAAHLALWGRADQATAVASRLLGAGDHDSFNDVLGAAAKAGLVLEPGVIAVALNSSSSAVINQTVWYLAELYAPDPAKLPEPLREIATTERDGASIAETFGREVLRRMLGAKPVERKDWLEWLATKEAAAELWLDRAARAHFTAAERAALEGDDGTARATLLLQSQEVATPEFLLPIVLPDGLAEAILKKTRCSDHWLGVVRATVDRVGRVQTVDLRGVQTTTGCFKALEAMLRLSLAEPDQITSPLTSSNLLVVKPRGGTLCFGEGPVEEVALRGLHRPGGNIAPPKVVKRVEPRFPEIARQEMKGGSVDAIAEAIITKQGCVRNVRLVKQTRWPSLNGELVLALAGWTFKPGKLDGKVVDVIFNLTVNYKLN